MRSFNSGREWRCALTPSVKEEPLCLGVQSRASNKFVTWTDVLIGPLTFGKTLQIRMSHFSLSDPKLELFAGTYRALHAALVAS